MNKIVPQSIKSLKLLFLIAGLFILNQNLHAACAEIEDYEFGYLMMMKIAQIIRDRLDSIVIETLAYQAEK